MVTRRRRLARPPATEAPERALAASATGRRTGASLTAAAALARTTPGTVRRYAASAWIKRGSRWRTTPYDRIPRAMNALSRAGPVALIVRDSRTASLIGLHAEAVRHYLEEWGDTARLEALPRTRFRANGARVELAVDPVEIDRLAAGGEVTYEIYRR